MSINSADLHAAVLIAWNDTHLDTLFKSYWSAASRSQFTALHDTEARPAQPMPYCVFQQMEGTTLVKMSGHANNAIKRFEVRDVPWEFVVHARTMAGTINKSAKQIASELVEEIIKVFGGHPEVEPVQLAITHGGHLQTTYITDWPMREGEQEFAWHVRYEFKLDVPVAA